MLHAGLDLSRKKLDVCLLSDEGEIVGGVRGPAGHRCLGKQRGAKVAQVDIARRLTEAVWHMLTTNKTFLPNRRRRRRFSSGRLTALFGLAPTQPASHLCGCSI